MRRATASSPKCVREEALKEVPVTCYGIDPEPFTCEVRNPEHPGEYCFPPLASLITAAARLMLALLERCVTDLGGTYAMEDTDSMAIVATQRGGLIECAGGPYRKAGSPRSGRYRGRKSMRSPSASKR